MRSKNKGNVNCYLESDQGSTQPCLQSWLPATVAVSGQRKETPQGTATLVLLGKADLKPENNAWAAEATALATKNALFAFWQLFSSKTSVSLNCLQAGSNRD